MDSQVDKINDFWIRRLKWAILHVEDDITNFSKSDIIKLSGVSFHRFEQLKNHLPELENL